MLYEFTGQKTENNADYAVTHERWKTTRITRK